MKVTFTSVGVSFFETATTWASEVTLGQENKHQTWSNYYVIKLYQVLIGHRRASKYGEFLRGHWSLIKLIRRMGAKDIPRRDPSESQEPQLPSTCHPLQPTRKLPRGSPWWLSSSPWRSTARFQTWAHSIRFLIIEWPSTTGLIFRQSYVSY